MRITRPGAGRLEKALHALKDIVAGCSALVAGARRLLANARAELSSINAARKQEITLRSTAEQALRASEEKFRSLIQRSMDIIVIIDQNGLVTYETPSFENLLGYPRGFILGKNPLDFIHPDDLATTARNLSYVYEKIHTGIPTEFRFRKADGTWVHLEALGQNLLDQPGINGVVIATHDITARKRAEEALKRSEERYRLVAENARDVIWVFDRNMQYTYVSPSVMYLRGYTAEEVMQQNIEEVLTPESYNKAKHILDREFSLEMSGARHGADWSYTTELEMIRKDGSRVWTEVIMNIIYDERNEPAGLMGITRDITERKRTEEEKKKLEDQLAQVQKMESIGTLAGGIAHDFNNLLTGILGNVSLARLGMEEDHPLYKRLKNIEEYVHRGSDLTKQLLGFARGGKYEVKPTHLGELIGKSAELFGRTKKEVRIHYQAPADLWTVEVDRGQMEQVLLNLYVNAAQAMPAGGDLSIAVANAALEENAVGPYGVKPGRFVRITVADTGVGMDAATQARIFEPFFTTKERGRGTGLGLASVYGIIKNHGGFITVESHPGVGTAFMIYLPASDKAVEEELRPTDEIARGRETILLIDDEQMILDIGAEMLAGLGYQVITAAGGRQGLKLYAAEAEHIDLVILDMIMPDITGKETFDGLRRMNASVRVLLASGYSLDSQAKEIIQSGCRGFIQKPFTLLELSQKIREILADGP